MRRYTAAEIERALALTVRQPYSHLISIGVKRIENRDHNRYAWYRGVVLIHAGKSRSMLDAGDLQRYPGMPFGAVEAIATITAWQPVEALPASLRSNEHANGPFCAVLEDVYRLPRPIPATGAQGLWKPQPAIVTAIVEQLEAAA